MMLVPLSGVMLLMLPGDEKSWFVPAIDFGLKREKI